MISNTESLSTHFDTSNDTLRHDLNVPYVIDELKNSGKNTPTGWRNILTFYRLAS